MQHKTFQTERLFIRPTSEDDAEFIFELLNAPKWKKFIGDRNIKSVEDAKQYIQNKMLPQLEKLGFSNNTLVLKSTNQKIGTCGLYNREGMQDVDIGFALLPQFEGHGYAFEAAKRIKNAAFEEFMINSLCGYTTKDNASSQKLLEKLGFECVGTIFIPNDEEELLLYRILRDQ